MLIGKGRNALSRLVLVFNFFLTTYIKINLFTFITMYTTTTFFITFKLGTF